MSTTAATDTSSDHAGAIAGRGDAGRVAGPTGEGPAAPRDISALVRRAADLSVRAKLVAMCLLLVMALSAVLLFELPRAMDAQSRGWVVSRSLGVGRLLASALEAAVDFDDAAAARRALGSLRTSRDALYAVVQRGDGTPLASWGAAPGVPELGGEPGEAAVVHGDHLDVRIPIQARSGRVGALFLGFGLHELEERRSDARRSVLWSAALFAGVGLAVAMALGTLIARPLLQITEVARRVALGKAPNAGDLPLRQRDEIGVLAGAFAHMLEQVEQQRAQIGRINADLAERVRERTHELARTNQALAELERTQEQLVMADRRVAVGRLAAGVAHEVNNPMASLSGNLEYVAAEVETLQSALTAMGTTEAVTGSLSEVARALADCRRGARRVVHIVRSLKTFARDDEDTREALPLERPVEAAIDMAMHEIKHRARLVRRYVEVAHVEANEVRLSQVFLNLLINAAHAIPDGDADLHEIRITLDVDREGRAIAEVSDTGCGMSPEVMARIFDPFFTTKAIGVGSGLGLSISRNIVQRLGGEISVRSQPGQGTTFRLTFPSCPSPRDPGPERMAKPPPGLAGMRLLVVDDDPDVSEAIHRLLAGDANVVTASGGREALDLLSRGEPFDAVLCDLMMPDVSGPELHDALAARRPEVLARTIFMTGGVFTDSARAFVERWGGPLLDKPLDPVLLRRTLHGLGT